ncbi:MAG: hypothetical protein QME52_10455 [Bacteroidota bacterium]|nr:hypothetical protein [Bacteroidota bacterium]
MSIVETIKEIIQPIIDSHEAFLIDLVVHYSRGVKNINIFIDNDQGVTTKLCADISRNISHALDAAELFYQRYYLVVSSPGIDRPLKLLRQYHKNVGRKMKIKYQENMQPEIIEGVLYSVTDTHIELKLTGNSIRTVPFLNILRAQVEVEW